MYRIIYLCGIIVKESSGNMKKRRIKKSVIKKGIIGLIILLALILLLIIKTVRYHNTNEYKLKQIGYNKEEIQTIKPISEENMTYILNNEYNEKIDDIIKQKYYIDKNLERYINYQKQTNNENIEQVVAIVNVNKDKEEYKETKKADLSKKELVLVNKYNYLDKDYKPENIINISNWYAYDGNETSKEILDKYIEMHEAAKQDGINLIISSAYRDYDNQQETYEYYKRENGEEYARKYASLPGYSEHQTGLAFDILTLGVLTDEFDKTKEYEWLINNSYKYGFILRYPKGKENITGYDYESWHYRYVGIEPAKTIHDENITFDEYYAYYIEK